MSKLYKFLISILFIILVFILWIYVDIYWNSYKWYKEIVLPKSIYNQYFDNRFSDYEFDYAARDNLGNLFISISKEQTNILIIDLVLKDSCLNKQLALIKKDSKEQDWANYTSVQNRTTPKFNLSSKLDAELICPLNISLKSFKTKSIESENMMVLYDINSFILGIGSNSYSDIHILRGNFKKSSICFRWNKDRLIVYISSSETSQQSLNELSKLLNGLG